MRIDKFTLKMQEALRDSHELAARLQHQELSCAHMLSTLLSTQGGIADPIFRKAGTDITALRTTLDAHLSRQPTIEGTAIEPRLGAELSEVFRQAESEMSALKDDYLSVEHFLLALFETNSPTKDLLVGIGVTKEQLLTALSEVRGSQRVTDQDPEGKYEALEKYGTDLTELARRGKIDPVIGRDEGDSTHYASPLPAHEEQPCSYR